MYVQISETNIGESVQFIKKGAGCTFIFLNVCTVLPGILRDKTMDGNNMMYTQKILKTALKKVLVEKYRHCYFVLTNQELIIVPKFSKTKSMCVKFCALESFTDQYLSWI